MSFQKLINEDMERIGCTLSELSRVSGLNAAVLSRYRSGEREPRLGSRQLEDLLNGLNRLELSVGLSDRSAQRRAAYENSLMTKRLLLPDRLSRITEVVPVTIKELSIALNYDASYLSRIRAGKRNPQDPEQFARNLCLYIIRSASPEQKNTLMELCKCSSEANLVKELSEWMVEKELPSRSGVDLFLKNLDAFDLNEFIRSVQFDSIVHEKPTADSPDWIYQGIDGIRQGELDFFRTILSEGTSEPVFMCNTMPIEKLAGNVSFVKNWMSLLTACMKKGMEFHVVHFVNRPMEEMMLGLESWIPLYMTGRITPWYLPGNEHSSFRTCLYVGGGAMLRGESYGNRIDHAVYEIHRDPSWIEYGRTRAQDILSMSRPLMKIYTGSQKELFLEYMKKNSTLPGTRRIRSCSLPLSSVTGDMLREYLESCHTDPDLIQKIEDYRRRELSMLHMILRSGTVVVEIPDLSREEFDHHTPSLFLAPMMENISIPYTWSFYEEHLQLTHEFAETNPGFSLIANPEATFRNISMIVHEDTHAVIMKTRSPEICFVITHPKMLQALSAFTPPVQDL